LLLRGRAAQAQDHYESTVQSFIPGYDWEIATYFPRTEGAILKLRFDLKS
jgi:hypothetical protein